MDASGSSFGERLALALVAAALLALACAAPALAAGEEEGIHKIRHVVMIMQENRSFDSYFGTYPGANGIPANVCVPNPPGPCVRPFHDPEDKNAGGPHGTQSAIHDIDGGRMDGFVEQAVAGYGCNETGGCNTHCGSIPLCGIDVMGYHDARDIPNYWEYAHNFVLQDDMFESAASWSLPEHLYLVSAWSAVCPHGDQNPLECVGSLSPEEPGLGWSGPIIPGKATYAWTDLTYLLYKAGVSWRYYVLAGDEPDCEVDEAVTCAKVAQDYKTPGIWNPLADFTDVNRDKQRGNIQPLRQFYTAVHQTPECGLPAVSWIDPNSVVSEHPPARISTGQAYVTTLINSIMRSPCWDHTAIFLSWDDWGGFYDHVKPPVIDEAGYGLRVPGLVISPYAKRGYIDHQQLSHDAYLKFIEDDFLDSSRLNPATDGRPDRRPDVREEAPGLGNLVDDFEFAQQPREPLLLPPDPPPGPASEPPGGIPNAPSVAALPVTSLTTMSATLNGTVDPNEATLSSCSFEYGTSSLLGSTAPCSPEPQRGGLPEPVSAAVGSLAPGATLYYRVAATNAGGSSTSATQAFTAPAASGSPEIGRCEKVATEPDPARYAEKTCDVLSKGEDSGDYEWRPGAPVSTQLVGAGGAVVLGPGGHWRVTCKHAAYEGSVTGERTLRTAITLTGCKSAALGVPCQSTKSEPGQIVTSELEGELGTITPGTRPVVGVDLKPSIFSAPVLNRYECASEKGGASFTTSEQGSVIGAIAPVQQVTTSSRLAFTTSGGAQVPEAFAGGTKDVLEASVTPSEGAPVSLGSTWLSAAHLSLGEPYEIRTVG